MNYDLHLTQLIDGLNADKTLAQPYKNYLISDAKRLQVSIRGTKTIALQKPDDESAARFPVPKDSTTMAPQGRCSCPPMEIDPSCPVHGDNA